MQLDTVASPAYRAILREQYEQPGWGSSGKSHADTVRTHARLIGARTALDYGCGRGTLAPAVPELDWQEFDPGIVGKDAMPQPADLVVATDVLEHVEPDRLTEVLAHVRALARMGTFLVIALTPAKLTLPDGRNAHLIVQRPDWWLNRLMEARLVPIIVGTKKGLWVWTR